jgi:hypothetical protein
MLSTGAGMYLHLPSSGPKRVLHPGTAISVDGDRCTIELNEARVPIEAGQNVFVYYELQQQFMQQPGHVDAVMHDGRTIVVGLELRGTPVSAESRQCYRVSAAVTGLRAEVGGLRDCPLIDVSLSGLSVLSRGTLMPGDIVDVAITFEGVAYTGQACVQSAVPKDEDRTRYGLHCIEDRRSSGNLQKGLQQMTMRIQQIQLRRRGRQG